MSFITSCLPCFRSCLDCVQGPSFMGSASYSNFTTPIVPTVRLDVGHMGKDVVLLKEGERICGTGAALATVPIVQNKAYFQVTLQQSGTWGIGLGNKNTNLDTIPAVQNFWGIRENGDVVANGDVIGKLNKALDEGDCIGVSYDHIELKFFVNGEEAEPAITNVKSPVYPTIYVDDSAIMDVKFKNFSYDAPPGFDEILVEQTLL
ncbi:unnamed protein product [Auanema sp. JU1783]|nr:unnamed protein product [Auanema sp. JU1783]